MHQSEIIEAYQYHLEMYGADSETPTQDQEGGRRKW